MNNTELLAKKWLLNKGYTETDIIFQPVDSPDFLCEDGKRYEVKYLYGRVLLFTKRQAEVLKDKDNILVFDRGGFKKQFLWKERENTIFKIKIYNPNENTTTIRISKETQALLDKHKIHPRETYDDLINRILAGIQKLKERGK